MAMTNEAFFKGLLRQLRSLNYRTAAQASLAFNIITVAGIMPIECKLLISFPIKLASALFLYEHCCLCNVFLRPGLQNHPICHFDNDNTAVKLNVF